MTTAATLFKDEPEPPIAISFKGYAVAFDAAAGLRDAYQHVSFDPEWQIDIDTICETREAVEQSIAESYCNGTWKIVKVKITAEELSPAPTN